MTTQVLIVDPTPAYRRGLGAALSDAGFAVEEAIGLEHLDTAELADVAVVTIKSRSVLDAVDDLASANGGVPVVALVEGRDPERVADALRAGVNGVVDRDAAPDIVANAVQAALGQHTTIPEWAARAFVARLPARPPSDQWINDDERRWLGLLARGATVAALADQVGYSEREMFRHLHDLYSRIKVRNRTEALLWADRHRLLDPQ